MTPILDALLICTRSERSKRVLDLDLKSPNDTRRVRKESRVRVQEPRVRKVLPRTLRNSFNIGEENVKVVDIFRILRSLSSEQMTDTCQWYSKTQAWNGSEWEVLPLLNILLQRTITFLFIFKNIPVCISSICRVLLYT